MKRLFNRHDKKWTRFWRHRRFKKRSAPNSLEEVFGEDGKRISTNTPLSESINLLLIFLYVTKLCDKMTAAKEIYQ